MAAAAAAAAVAAVAVAVVVAAVAMAAVLEAAAIAAASWLAEETEPRRLVSQQPPRCGPARHRLSPQPPHPSCLCGRQPTRCCLRPTLPTFPTGLWMSMASSWMCDASTVGCFTFPTFRRRRRRR